MTCVAGVARTARATEGELARHRASAIMFSKTTGTEVGASVPARKR